MIGLSISFCIRDIIRGKVQESDVEKIIANTWCETKEHWEEVILIYRKSCWYDNPEVGEAVCWRFVAENKIEQPRCQGKGSHNIADGHWMKDGLQIRLA